MPFEDGSICLDTSRLDYVRSIALTGPFKNVNKDIRIERRQFSWLQNRMNPINPQTRYAILSYSDMTAVDVIILATLSMINAPGQGGRPIV